MNKKGVASFILLLLFSSIAIERALGADIPLLECQEAKLAEQLTKQRPIFPISVDLAEFSRRLQILRAQTQPTPVYMGVSQGIPRGKIMIRTAEASARRVRKAKNGLVVRCGDSILFATSVGVPTDGSYSLSVVAKAPNAASVSLIDISKKATPASFVPFPGMPTDVIAIIGPFKGPKAVLVVVLPRKVRDYEISLTQIIPTDWPNDPQALIPVRWSPAKTFGAAPQVNPPTPELDAAKAVVGPMAVNDQTIPANFLDYECMRNHDLFGRFPVDLRSHVNSIGLLEAFVWQGSQIAQGYCTATLVTFDRDPKRRTFLLTANHCFGNVNRAAQQTDIVSARVFWDYRNAQCTKGPPARWPDSQIHSLPNSNLALVSATAISDAAILDLIPVPTDRSPLRAGGTPDYTANNVFRMRFHHADIRPLMGSEPYWDWKSEPGFPIGGYSGACQAQLPASNFFYSMWIVHSQSSASAPGSSGAAVIDQNGHVVGQLWGWCLGAMSAPGPYYNYNVDGKIERTLNILGLPP